MRKTYHRRVTKEKRRGERRQEREKKGDEEPG